jgi:predicted aldo/keto reductase-like oxidoreductase
MPCSSGVEISRIFQIYNEAMMYENPRAARWAYGELKEEQRADQCTKCEECMDACPQEMDIPEWLEKAHMFLTPKEKSGS